MRRARAAGSPGEMPEADGNRSDAAAAAEPSTWSTVTCTRAGLSVSAGEHGRVFAPGDVVDLNKPIGPNASWRDAIGVHLADFFVPSDGEGA